VGLRILSHATGAPVDAADFDRRAAALVAVRAALMAPLRPARLGLWQLTRQAECGLRWLLANKRWFNQAIHWHNGASVAARGRSAARMSQARARSPRASLGEQNYRRIFRIRARACSGKIRRGNARKIQRGRFVVPIRNLSTACAA
jgi:hypothetical protein